MNKKATAVACGVLLSVSLVPVQAAVLEIGDILTIDPGIATYDEYGNQTSLTGGSWFGVDGNGDQKIVMVEKTALAQGSKGIVIGYAQPLGEITAPYYYYGNTGQEYTTQPVTGGSGSGLDFSGLTWYWNSVTVPFGSGAWTPQNCVDMGVPCAGYADGLALFSWSGLYGDGYSLDYALTIPEGDPSVLGGFQFFYHLEGVVMSEVPVPAAIWLFGSGLLALLGATGRRSVPVART